MREIELLCPAKNKECAIAAIDNGADAVYIGAERFGARAAAGNSVQDIREVVEYACQFGVKVYVTLNTLLYDDEVEKAVGLALQLQDVGVDAFIIQDMKLYDALIHNPQWKGVLHSSTQMDNRNTDVVKLRQKQGFQQTVLARELTIEEIAEIHKSVPEMPLEVFIHGAICVCYNGCCYASEVCYGRSANRGECAQFCRMPYKLISSDSSQRVGEGGETVIAEGYLLSMRDMNRTKDLEALLDAGVSSFKIEGRLKDPMYVKNVTAWYRQKLDAILKRRPEFHRSSFGRETFSFSPDVNRTFNRGYTDYFMHGRTSDLCNTITPKSTGEKVGFIKEIRRDHIVVAGTSVFHNGDGLIAYVQRAGKTEVIGFRINRAENNHLYPFRMPKELKDGMILYRNQDEAMEHILSGKTSERRIPLTWILNETKDGFALSAKINGEEYVKYFECEHQLARTDQTNGITELLSKLGDTIYVCDGVTINFSQQWFIPRSKLAEWRRDVIGNIFSDSNVRTQQGNVCSSINNIPASSNKSFDGQTLMICRYCIRYQIGQCLVQNRDAVKGQMYLDAADGRRFPLKFDCKKCEMHVIACEK